MRNPANLEMDHPFELGDEKKLHWIDVMIKLPHLFRWKWDYVYSIYSETVWRVQESEARELGFDYPMKNPKDNVDKFRCIYTETEAIMENELIHYYEEWVKIFIPQFTKRIKTGTYGK